MLKNFSKSLLPILGILALAGCSQSHFAGDSKNVAQAPIVSDAPQIDSANSSPGPSIEPSPSNALTVKKVPPALADIPQPSCSRWHNSKNPSDVNGDGFISPSDALDVINDINAFGARPLSSGTTPVARFLDVTGDCYISALDAMIVINAVNLKANLSCLKLHNTNLALDVNGDGVVDEADAQAIIDDIKANGSRPTDAVAATGSNFFDVDGDCMITTSDVNAVISGINNSTLKPLISPWQNPVNRFDVNGDGQVDNFDLVDLTADLDANGARPVPISVSGKPTLFPDVDGDGWVTSKDAEVLRTKLSQ